MGIQERKGREKERRKEEILDAAQRVFIEKGLTTATVDDIATAAELSKGTIYLHFESKEDIYVALMMRGIRLLYSMFKGIISHETSVVKILYQLEGAYTEFFNTQRNYFRMLDSAYRPNVHKEVSEEMRKTYAAESQKNWELIIEIFNRGVQEKKIRNDINPIDMAIIIWSNATSLMTRIDREGETWKKERNIDLKHTLAESFHLLLDAILTPQGRREYATLIENQSRQHQ
ncbi:MAG: TetR/AcrR family transcriptional regulator [Bacteroidota bacterium]